MIISVSDFVFVFENISLVVRQSSFHLLVGVAYQFLIDEISVFSAYVIRNTDNIWDTGI